MPRLGEAPHRRGLFAGLAALLIVPMLGGAAGLPESQQHLPVASVLPSATEPPPAGEGPLRRTTEQVDLLLPAESLVGGVPRRPRPVALSPTITDQPPARGERGLPAPVLRPSDPTWIAQRLEIPALGVNVAVAMAGSTADELFPPYGGAYILRSSSQPGRGTNSYLFAHAMPELFKPLWWAQIGQQVIVTMSDGQQLGYRVTAVVRDIPCPDPSAHKPAGLPPVLANATECDLTWTYPTGTERLTMQTSQGFNRNYGEMVVIAEPAWGD